MKIFSALKTIPILLLFLIGTIHTAKAQVEKDSDLFLMLKTNDSLLFQQGYNSCDMSMFEELLSDNFEFYHDKNGIMTSKDNFMEYVRLGICKPGSSKDPRILVAGSLEVFPLLENGFLYGAIQEGIHTFGNTTAKFTHLWIKEGSNWRISRVLSYNHLEE